MRIGDIAILRRLSVIYGRNRTLEKHLQLVVCLCTNNGTCDFDQTTPITLNYETAACHCPPQYDGMRTPFACSLFLTSRLFFDTGELCQDAYNACASSSPCTVNWIDGTSCVSLSPDEQVQQNRSYYCIGSCVDGYNSTDGYTCEGKCKFSLYSFPLQQINTK
jgi:hypothetical protein